MQKHQTYDDSSQHLLMCASLRMSRNWQFSLVVRVFPWVWRAPAQFQRSRLSGRLVSPERVIYYILSRKHFMLYLRKYYLSFKNIVDGIGTLFCVTRFMSRFKVSTRLVGTIRVQLPIASINWKFRRWSSTRFKKHECFFQTATKYLKPSRRVKKILEYADDGRKPLIKGLLWELKGDTDTLETFRARVEIVVTSLKLIYLSNQSYYRAPERVPQNQMIHLLERIKKIIPTVSKLSRLKIWFMILLVF